LTKPQLFLRVLFSNHPFVDGNKRTAYVVLRLIPKRNQLDLKVDQDVKYDFVIKAAKGELTFDKIRAWITGNLE
jgi:death-on-curing protein